MLSVKTGVGPLVPPVTALSPPLRNVVEFRVGACLTWPIQVS